jgi:RimJ/RimL family protein N-acetyltransferase
MIFRPIAAAEVPLFTSLPYVLNHELADDLADGRRHPEWMWVALDGDRVVARVAWWGRDRTPTLLDILDLASPADVATATELVTRAAAAVVPNGSPEYVRFAPPDWRAAPEDVESRMAVLSAIGARFTLERLRLEWRAGTPLPAADDRLTFRPAGDDLIGLLTRILAGTLDAHSRADLASMPAHEVATQQYEDEFARYDTPRDWWRVGLRADGEPVGLVIAARNAYNPVLAYLGVLPEHRGNGYANGLLAEGTRVLAEAAAPRIRASTDVGNEPMARAFAKAGYVDFERTITMDWD